MSNFFTQKTQKISLTKVYTNSIFCLIQNPLSLCLIAPFLIVAPSAVSLIAGTLLRFDIYTHISSGPFAPWEGKESLDNDAVFGLLVLASILGIVGATIARGISISQAIKFAAVTSANPTWRAIQSQFAAICICIILQSAVLSFGAVEANAQIFYNESIYSIQYSSSGSNVLVKPLRLLSLRLLDQLIPLPQAPYIQFVPLWRNRRIEAYLKEYEMAYWQELNNSMHGGAISTTAQAGTVKWGVMGASLLPILISEIFLRFSQIVVLDLKMQLPLAIVKATAYSVWLGLKHLRVIFIHVVFLRLISITSYGLLILLPLAIWQEYIPINIIVSNQDATSFQHWTKTIAIICAEYLSSLIFVFSSICDTHLYLQFQKPRLSSKQLSQRI